MRGVAQRLARMVWDHEVGGSNPLTPTIESTKLEVRRRISHKLCYSVPLDSQKKDNRDKAGEAPSNT